MKRLLLALALFFAASEAQAQNTTCVTRTPGDSSNACASTAFVGSAISNLGGAPTAQVGLTAITGTATSYIRSDGAPALSQSISPTWTGTHIFAPSVATSTALNTRQSPVGTNLTQNCPLSLAVVNNYCLDIINLSNGVVEGLGLATPGGFVNGVAIAHRYGGTTVNGGRQTLLVRAGLDAATNAANPSKYYAAGVFQQQATANDGGTAPTLANGAGHIYALNGIVAATASATNFLAITGAELDVYVDAAASTYYKAGLNIAQVAGDATQGSVYDAAIMLSSEAGGVSGWKNGIQFSAANGANPMAATGTLISTNGSATVDSGIDLSSYTISTSAFKSTGFNVDGLGTITSRGITYPATGISGGIPYFASTSTLSSTSLLATNALMVGGGAGGAPKTLSSLGTTATVLHGNAGSFPSWGAVALGTEVSGQLPLANGGTNANLTANTGGIVYSGASAFAVLSGTATANLPLLSGSSTTPGWAAITYPTSATSGGIPYFSSTSAMGSSALLTANGVVYGGGAGAAPASTAAGTTGQILTGVTSGAPSWASAVSIGTSLLVGNTTGLIGTMTVHTAADKNLFLAANTAGIYFGCINDANDLFCPFELRQSYLQIGGIGAGGTSHITTQGPGVPALSSCGGGSPTISGTDTAGLVTMGTTASGCVITFNTTYAAAPYCVVTWQATPLATQSYTTTATGITTIQTATSGNKLNYHCIGQTGG